MFKLTPNKYKVVVLWVATIVIHAALIATGMLAAKLMFGLDIPIISTAILLLGYAIGNVTKPTDTNLGEIERLHKVIQNLNSIRLGNGGTCKVDDSGFPMQNGYYHDTENNI